MVSLSACGQDYYGNDIDSIKHNVVETKDISMSGLKLDDSPEQAVRLLGEPSKKRVGTDDITDENFTMFHYGPKDKTFLYFYQDNSDVSMLNEFLLFDSLFSINIGQNNFKVDENLEKLQNIYPGSYAAYQENSSLYKSFRLIVFEGKKRKGLEIIFVIKENKIYNISTRYDE